MLKQELYGALTRLPTFSKTHGRKMPQKTPARKQIFLAAARCRKTNEVQPRTQTARSWRGPVERRKLALAI